MLAAKYTWNQFKLFGGYEYILQLNPAHPLGVGAMAQGGYQLSGVEDTNLNSPKRVQVMWTGVKYAYDAKTDVTLSYYHEIQNDFRVPSTCSVAAGFRSSCAGTFDEVSLYVDYHFTKRFDVFGGITYSQSPAVSPSPFLTAPASPITTTTILLRPLAFVTLFDRRRRGCRRCR